MLEFIERAIAARTHLFDEKHQAALRLFNGFYEGNPALIVDLYARTAVIHNYADAPLEGLRAVRLAQDILRARLPWVECIVLKTRGGSPTQKRGELLFGDSPDRRVTEHGIRYAIDLTMNQDASLYLDTRNLRKWAIENLHAKNVLNTFAYTGSLGVAAMGAGAQRVVQLDRNRDFLNLAKESYTLNGFPIEKRNFIADDFFPALSRIKQTGELFDFVFLDPPFFSTTRKGRVDLESDSARLINKVRPLITDGGYLVTINNALFVSGAEYMEIIESLCLEGYLKVETLIPVPEDFTGFLGTRVGKPPVDPAPFNHPTKIAVLRVKRD